MQGGAEPCPGLYFHVVRLFAPSLTNRMAKGNYICGLTGATTLPIRRSAAAMRPPSSESQASDDRPSRPPLLLIDFDKTLTDCDAGALIGYCAAFPVECCAYAHPLLLFLT